ncbi:MAG: hypothetical protein IKX68_08575 [Clostridiales bacterium]|nr:hypothetical protein [Clostridiales bacterium]
MKKSVLATVLAVSLLFTACSTKDQKTTSENETSEAVSETTEKTSESETDTTEDPTDPSVNEIVSYDAPSFGRINYVSYEMNRESVFAFEPRDMSDDVSGGYNCIDYFLAYYGYPLIKCYNDVKLNDLVKEDCQRILPDAGEYLEGMKDECVKEFGNDSYGVTSEYDLTPFVLRADEKITTIYYPYSPDRAAQEDFKELTAENLINYDTVVAEKITLSDVVKDKDRFTEIAKERIMDTLTEEDLMIYKESDVLEFLNSDDIPFTIDYSGITVYFNIGIFKGYMRAPAHIEYIGNEDVFNAEYFDSLPENYVLHISPKTDFYWDLDGDGKTEDIYVDIEVGQELSEIGSFSIRIDDQETKVDTSSSTDYDIAESLMLVHTHGQDFLYIWTVGADDMMGVSIYEIVDKKAEDRGVTGKWLKAPCQNFDPEQIELFEEIYAAGLEIDKAVYHIDKDGKPVTDQELVSVTDYYGHIFPCLKKDVKVDKVDPKTLEKTGSVTLKAGTNLWPLFTNRKDWEEEAFEIFKVIDKDTSKEFYVRLDLSFEESEYEASIDGVGVRDLFVRAFLGA